MFSGMLSQKVENQNQLCLGFFQDEEKKQQARDLFEESANQGCLTSSYLLWESDRRMDVSGPGSGERRDYVGQKHSLLIGP